MLNGTTMMDKHSNRIFLVASYKMTIDDLLQKWTSKREISSSFY